MRFRGTIPSLVVLAFTFAAVTSGVVLANEPDMSMSAGSQALHTAMEKGEKDMKEMKMTGDADHDFAMMMVAHHKSAIVMSDIILKHGKDPKIQAMAGKIIDAQKKEIAEFEAWMKMHKPAAAGHAH